MANISEKSRELLRQAEMRIEGKEWAKMKNDSKCEKKYEKCSTCGSTKIKKLDTFFSFTLLSYSQ